jgi:hypothetical protein
MYCLCRQLDPVTHAEWFAVIKIARESREIARRNLKPNAVTCGH